MQNIDIQENLKEEIHQSFEDKENKHWHLWQEEKSLLVAVSKYELEDLRQVGATIVQQLQPSSVSSSVEAVLENLELFSEKEKYALLEGVLLSSYHLINIYPKKRRVKSRYLFRKPLFLKSNTMNLTQFLKPFPSPKTQ